MEPASADGGRTSSSAALRRYGPLAALGVIALVVVGIVVSSGGDGGDNSIDDTAATPVVSEPGATDPPPPTSDIADSTSPPDGADPPPPATDPPGGGGATFPDSPFPPGVMTFSVAQELGLDLDFGERCDPETGRVAVPDFFGPECFLPFEGDNGGATDRGVTGDAIRIVYWQAQEEDPILRFVTSAIVNDDTNAQDEETVRKMIEYWETYYETYGRSIELIVVEGSGTITDEAAARADAVAIDEDLDPFMVWGGPMLTNAFAEELAARGIPCISCGPAQTRDYYQDEYPGLQYTVTKSGEQLDHLVAEYVGKKLTGAPAIHAGDESLHDTERVFGRIWIESSPASVVANETFEGELGEYGVTIAESQSYALDPATLQESAATIIARMKEAGVTSIIFNGDPIAPRDFTNEATAQNYFPEWIVTGSVLVDTAAFARTYDQQQWTNAFGISNLSARVRREVASSFANYEWFHGERPPADDNIGVLTPAPQTFYSYLQLVGPELTTAKFNTAIFSADPSASALTAASLSFGEKGIWPDSFDPDYHGVDDISEVWWDPDAVGPDEIDKEGPGLWRWVDGGLRHKPGELPAGPPKAFVEEGSVTIYDVRPPEEATPDDYVPLRPS